MSRLSPDLNDISTPSSELEMQFEQYLKIRVGRDEKQLEAAMREMMLLLRDLSQIEPTLEEACTRWTIMILTYVGVIGVRSAD